MCLTYYGVLGHFHVPILRSIPLHWPHNVCLPQNFSNPHGESFHSEWLIESNVLQHIICRPFSAKHTYEKHFWQLRHKTNKIQCMSFDFNFSSLCGPIDSAQHGCCYARKLVPIAVKQLQWSVCGECLFPLWHFLFAATLKHTHAHTFIDGNAFKRSTQATIHIVCIYFGCPH